MKKIIFLLLVFASTASVKAQHYTLADISNSIKTFDTHIVLVQEGRVIDGAYNSVLLQGTYFKITLQGQLLESGSVIGSLTKIISFDARDISSDITVVPVVYSGTAGRWDVVFKTKKNLTLVHINDYLLLTGQTSPSVNGRSDLNTFNIMFCSLDAANRFQKMAKAVFK